MSPRPLRRYRWWEVGGGGYTHQIPLGLVASYISFMLTCAFPMASQARWVTSKLAEEALKVNANANASNSKASRGRDDDVVVVMQSSLAKAWQQNAST